LIATSARGLFTGNRGIIHDADTKTLSGKRWSTPAWICCTVDWKGRRRDVWGRNRTRPDGSKGLSWSELFFLDEVTALAAGHRPCHTCRNKDAKAFHQAYCAANGQLDATGKNRLLHAERWQSRKEPPIVLTASEISDLPDGVILLADDVFFAIKQSALFRWTLEGYEAPAPLSLVSKQAIALVTPPSMVGALREGYQPRWHPGIA